MTGMTREQHRQRHLLLHRYLDELLADFLMQNQGAFPSKTPLLTLMKWSADQCTFPTDAQVPMHDESIQ